MSITGLTAVTRVAPTIADTPTATAPIKQIGAVTDVEIDAVTQKPSPPRFPWLSRLSQELEQASRQKPPFPSAPVLGDNVDRAV